MELVCTSLSLPNVNPLNFAHESNLEKILVSIAVSQSKLSAKNVIVVRKPRRKLKFQLFDRFH